VEVNPDSDVQTVIRPRDKQMLFDRIPFKPADAQFQTGDLNNDVNWDGVMCSDPKLNVRLRNQSASMSLNFKAEDTDQLHLSVWVNVHS